MIEIRLINKSLPVQTSGGQQQWSGQNTIQMDFKVEIEKFQVYQKNT